MSSDKAKQTASKGSTGQTAQSKAAHKPAFTQAEKRAKTEMENSSFGDEITMINKQLEQLSEDTKKTAEKVKDMLTRDEMRDFITTTVNVLMKELQVRIEKEIDTKVQEKIKEKTTEINDRLDSLTYENVQLRERLEKVEIELKANEALTQTAMRKSNYNEQYSRKNNIKIMGVPEKEDETIEILEDTICEILHKKAGLMIDPRKIDAIHRIPGKAGMPKPVLLKMRNNHEKTKIMRHRKEMKEAGYRLVDDVTKLNTELINRLTMHEHIASAWFFNGSVYGKTTAGKRHKFELYCNISKVIRVKSDDVVEEEDKMDC